MTIATLATAFAKAFITKTREDGSEFVLLVDGSPKWMEDAIRDAHGDMLPEDTRYRMIRNAVDQMAETLDYDADADLDDMRAPAIDSLIPVYNRDRLDWLASSLNRAEYCDEAQREGLVAEDASMFDRIAVGITSEYEEIWSAIARAIEEQADEEAAGNDDEEEPA